MKRSVLLTLKSPYFLYPDPPIRKTDEHRVAARLALTMWDSIPNDQLAKAARQGKLNSREEVIAQARNMLTDPRAQAKVMSFFHHWLEMDSERDLTKDSAMYPEFKLNRITDLRRSLELFIEEVVWSESSDYRQLLLARHLPLNKPLAQLYGKNAESEGFAREEFDPKRRAGLITHPYLLTTFAYPNNSSPLHRGRWRYQENKQPVNATSEYETTEGKRIRLRVARDLAEFAANDKGAQKAFVRQLFQYLVKHPADAYGEETLENLHRHFKKSQFNIKNLILEIVCTVSMHGMKKNNS